MNRYILIFLTAFLPLFGYGQSAGYLSELNHYRIHLNNRTNKHLISVSSLLLEGFSNGKFNSYYPLALENQLNFGDFLKHFDWSEPMYLEDDHCGEHYFNNSVYKTLFSKFNTHIDYYESNHYELSSQRVIRKVEFIQLIYTTSIYGRTYNFKGPVFRMDEIRNSIFLNITSSTAEKKSLGFIFDQAIFTAVEIAKGNTFNSEDHNNRENDFGER
ncbi:MAG: hypothetical protein H6605_03110 [Flavobacteriales bacterium]|nr:hypothetical protein [Flavobacteriales bacterium]